MEELLSNEEREAETIFMLTVCGLIDHDLFVYMSNHLRQRDKLASCYLKWLMINEIITCKYKNKKQKINIFNII